MKMTVSYFKAVKSNTFSLHGTRPDGERCLVQMLLPDTAPLDQLKESLSELFAKFEEEVVKPRAPDPEPDPVLSDPNILTKSYDAIAKDARAEGMSFSEYVAAMSADGWTHMPNHAAMQRHKPSA